MNSLPREKEVDIRSFEQMLDYRYLTNSYKLYWFYGVFSEIIEGKQTISFTKVAHRMIALAWYPVVKYRLSFGVQDQLSEVIYHLLDSYLALKQLNDPRDILLFVESIDSQRIDNKINALVRYVPYRLLTPFFSGELRGIKDSRKNLKITVLSAASTKALYSVDEQRQTLTINQQWMDYIQNNQNLIYGWLKYKLIYFLQKRNPNVPAIPFKLDIPYKRDLKRAREYWSILTKKINARDIYTNEPLANSSFSVDHFIPWSFVLHDELWNLVPTMRATNSSKSDLLPTLNIYLDRFCELQYHAFKSAVSLSNRMLILEDFLTIDKGILSEPVCKTSFYASLKGTIQPLYQIALNQGYQVWHHTS